MIICGKCRARGTAIILNEMWRDHGIQFQQMDDGGVSKEGFTMEGDPYEVRAHCMRCQHKWKLRGVSQITELDRSEIGYLE